LINAKHFGKGKEKMNKLEEYKSKINYDVWEDIMPIKQRMPCDETEKINAIRNVILKEFWPPEDGGESG
jgi:hypothetical protein